MSTARFNWLLMRMRGIPWDLGLPLVTTQVMFV